MKKLFVLVVLFIGTFQAFSQEEHDTKLNWLTDFNEAKKEAKTLNKPILIFFTGSDWCTPCKSLKQDFFNTDAFETKAESFVLLMVDIPRRTDIITPEQRKKNEAIVAKYNKQGGYPNIVVLNNKLKVLGELSGYTLLREIDTHVAFVDQMIMNYKL